jgi:hypothetical protein
VPSMVRVLAWAAGVKGKFSAVAQRRVRMSLSLVWIGLVFMGFLLV